MNLPVWVGRNQDEMTKLEQAGQDLVYLETVIPLGLHRRLRAWDYFNLG